jgi:hypothetical protein
VYASGCVVKESFAASRSLADDITAAAPLDTEYELDLVYQVADGTLSDHGREYYCALTNKRPGTHRTPACYATDPHSDDELISMTIADKDGQTRQAPAGADIVSGAIGDTERYRLISHGRGYVSVYCQEGPCGLPAFGCGLLTVVPS